MLAFLFILLVGDILFGFDTKPDLLAALKGGGVPYFPAISIANHVFKLKGK